MRKLIFAIALVAITSCSSRAAESASPEAAPVAAAPAKEAVINVAPGGDISPIPGKLVVVDFNADWCGPCRRFAPEFHAVAQQTPGAVFYSVNVDKCRALAERYGVESIPFVLFLHPDGSGTYATGYMDREQFASIVASQLQQLKGK